MLTQEFDRETERYLADILAYQNMTSDELIRQLIRDRWLTLQQVPVQTAEDAAEITPELPKHKNQKQQIAEFVRRKYQRSLSLHQYPV